MIKAREAAYLAVLDSLRHNCFASQSLKRWQQQVQPSAQDFNLAQEIAYGSIRLALTLDFYAAACCDKTNLKIGLRERALIRTALYQLYYLDRVPAYAVVNETVKLANRCMHRSFGAFLNFLLRQATLKRPALPLDDGSLEALSLTYSYPPFFIAQLKKEQEEKKIKELLEMGNQPAVLTYRIRQMALVNDALLLSNDPPVAILQNTENLKEITDSPAYYVQNTTPILLLDALCKQKKALHAPPLANPLAILDLCAAPGGKLLGVYDFFPEAQLQANDISEEKIKVLQENCQKYAIPAQLTQLRGEEYPLTQLFDIVILDVPCSNTGVLNKRPEARWRLTEENLASLLETQKKLLMQAVKLLKPAGQLWYLTCSILKEENEERMQWAAEQFSLTLSYQQTILPQKEGWDGGYACALIHQ